MRRVPNVWNEASANVDIWPQKKLSPISFRSPRERLQWPDLDDSFRHEVSSYLEMRRKIDLFADGTNAPTRALAKSTLKLHRDNIRLAASVLTDDGLTVESLADLIKPEHFKAVLRHYHVRTNGQATGFARSMANTLIGVARYWAKASPEDVTVLKRASSRLPAVPLDLTEKNKALLRQLESERTLAALMFLPDDLLREVALDLKRGRVRHADAQVAIAIDILLAVPIRSQNLCRLIWNRHFSEPDGPRGRLLMYIPAEETKGKKKDFVAEIPDEVARRLRWYVRSVLPRLNGTPDGCLFVTKKGRAKNQDTLSDQISAIIAKRVGIHMTPHQFRHLSATSYLAANPGDFETVRQMLGHGFIATSRVYGGVNSRRALGAFHCVLLEKRESLRPKRPRNARRKRSLKGGR